MSHTDSASPINTIIIKIILHTYLKKYVHHDTCLAYDLDRRIMAVGDTDLPKKAFGNKTSVFTRHRKSLTGVAYPSADYPPKVVATEKKSYSNIKKNDGGVCEESSVAEEGMPRNTTETRLRDSWRTLPRCGDKRDL